MKAPSLRIMMLAVLFANAASLAFADDPPGNTVQVSINFKAQNCPNAGISVHDLGQAYYTKLNTGDSDDFIHDVQTILTTTCKPDGYKVGDYVVIFFLAKPTRGADAPVVVHFIYHSPSDSEPGTTSLPGINAASWLYLTDEDSDEVVTQIAVSPVENPLISQIGSLAEAVQKPFTGANAFILKSSIAQAAAHPIKMFMASSVPLHFKRGTISETDYVSTPNKDSKGEYLDPNGTIVQTADQSAKKQVTSTATFSNTPKDWVAFTAGAGILVGRTRGVQQMKVDSNSYAANPLSKAATMAGLTLHFPYNSTALDPTWRERVGLFVGGVLTPAGGIVVAPSAGWRGISIAAGYSWMFVQTAPFGKNAGDAAVAGSSQIRSGTARATIVGLTYAFGGK